jgi:hypothetical protein
MYFGFSQNGLIKIWSPFDDPTGYKISRSHVGCCQLYVHIGSMNVHLFRMFDAMGFKKYGVKVALNGKTSLLNPIKMY